MNESLRDSAIKIVLILPCLWFVTVSISVFMIFSMLKHPEGVTAFQTVFTSIMILVGISIIVVWVISIQNYLKELTKIQPDFTGIGDIHDDDNASVSSAESMWANYNPTEGSTRSQEV